MHTVLQDAEREGVEIDIPNFEYEIELFYKYSRKHKRADIDKPLRGVRDQETFEPDIGAPFTVKEVEDAIQDLRALGFNRPLACSRGDYEKFFDIVSLHDAACMTVCNLFFRNRATSRASSMLSWLRSSGRKNAAIRLLSSSESSRKASWLTSTPTWKMLQLVKGTRRPPRMTIRRTANPRRSDRSQWSHWRTSRWAREDPTLSGTFLWILPPKLAKLLAACL